MKKNVMMRIASFLLVAVLISTSAISGTYAKYVTEGTGSDSARVAKWGVGIVVNGETFADAYVDGKVARTDANTVLSAVEGDDVVAPGTNGSLGGVTLAGIPEVDFTVTYKAELNLANWEVKDTAVYCPIIITVKRTEGTSGATNTEVFKMEGDIDTLAELETAVENFINNNSIYYEAGTNLAEKAADSLVVTWEWPFSTSDANDKADTALGNQAADTTDGIDAATIEFKLTCTATQVD